MVVVPDLLDLPVVVVVGPPDLLDLPVVVVVGPLPDLPPWRGNRSFYFIS